MAVAFISGSGEKVSGAVFGPSSGQLLVNAKPGVPIRKVELPNKDKYSVLHSTPATISSVSNNGGKLQVASTGHGLQVGDYIVISGSTGGVNDGLHRVVTVVNANAFVTDKNYNAAATPGQYTKLVGFSFWADPQVRGMTFQFFNSTLHGFASLNMKENSLYAPAFGTDFGIHSKIYVYLLGQAVVKNY